LDGVGAHGYDVRTDAIQGATHQTVYSAAVIGPVAAAWVLSLPGAHAGQGQPSPS